MSGRASRRAAEQRAAARRAARRRSAEHATRADSATDDDDSAAQPEETPPPRWDLDDIGVVAMGVAYVVLLMFPWYEARGPEASLVYSGWGLGLPVVAALLAGYAAGRVVLLRGKPQKPDVPVTPAAETFVVAVLALLLTVYRAIDVPSVPDAQTVVRTPFLSCAAAAVLLQAVFAARKLGKVGVRA